MAKYELIEVCGKKYEVGYAVFDCIRKQIVTEFFSTREKAEKWIDDIVGKFEEKGALRETFQIVKVLEPIL